MADEPVCQGAIRGLANGSINRYRHESSSVLRVQAHSRRDRAGAMRIEVASWIFIIFDTFWPCATR
jgi:hypothetical protein